ncbi:hypothetical protein OKA05_06350 [Luteolibacter arcticus]|uniref:Uncharacterized protein n=1 Tax=Luteolibacter arcticus TaxID=1581411 RepID=A0ABT3GEX4_9BACT|nr:hypothetical protein [Luteolibacter arcticus]MCW1922165.1 hypothetical protein [Luteolibacter arcticus]
MKFLAWNQIRGRCEEAMEASSHQVVFNTPIQRESLEGRGEPLLEMLSEAHEYALSANRPELACSIRELWFLVGSNTFSQLLNPEKDTGLRASLSKFFEWIADNLEALCFIPQRDKRERHIERIRVSLNQALRQLKKIIKHEIGGALIKEFRQAAMRLHKTLVGVLKVCCGNFRKLGLSANKSCHHFFIKFLVPKPREDILYGVA